MPTLRDVHERRAVRRVPVGDLLEVLVGLDGGELAVRHLDLVYASAGRPVRLLREYRSRSRLRAGVGAGWRLVAPAAPEGSEPSVLVDDQGRVVTLHGDEDGLITKIVDPLGAQAAALTYDRRGRLVRHTDAAGHPYTFTWDDDGRLTGLGDPAGGSLEFAYDARHAVTRVEWRGDGGAGRLAFGYAEGGTSVTDAGGRVTVHRFDVRGRLIGVAGPARDVWRWEWDDRDLLTSSIDPLGRRTAYEYDDAGNLTGLRLPTSARVSAGYGAVPGLPTALRDPAGAEVRLSHDTAGRPVRIDAPGRAEPLETRAYEPVHGRLAARTDGNGATTTYAYDDAGNLVTVTPPEPLGAVRYRYDRLSRVTGVTAGDGRRTGYRHDAAGRLTEVTDEDSGDVLVSLSYDALGRVSRRSGPGWSQEYRWTRTARGNRLTRAVRTAPGEPAEEVRYEYGPDGELTALTTLTALTRAEETTRYAYDPAGRLATVTAPGGQVARFTHDAAGRVTEVDLGAAIQKITYDASGRRTGLTVTGPGGTPLSAEYGYGTAGADHDVLLRAVVDGEVTEYAYDGLKRLARAGDVTYEYDAAHNLVRLGDVRFTVNAAGQVTLFGETEFTYDGAGHFAEEVNPTGSFTYSATGQTVTGVFGGQKVVDVAYDGLDQRTPRRITETTVDGRTVTHVLTWSELGAIRVLDDGVATGFVRTPDGALLAVVTSAGRHHWAVTDQHGSVLALVDEKGEIAARYRYTPHGAVTATGDAAAANPFRFRGAYQLLRSAYVLDDHLYNGRWGRFTQPDPTGQAYAPYTFGDNDPVNAGTWTRAGLWTALAGPPERVTAAFFPTPPEPADGAPPEPGRSAAPGVAPDRLPLITGASPRRFPLHS
ncbi:hypothetical protein GCM10009677_63780 [Sphaerisporangium rubeum]|uniref:RHS repeat-associated protein n=1 Tax=Sphaerisporangium rubeum TaxID=321317 RepID=A0A7X0IKI4_9ACTN|nr:RHS repeat-associated protein [Sphaerisporangium rubeum]